jgi:uncharacterized protein YfaS (alpha-2-macroglobulin family)
VRFNEPIGEQASLNTPLDDSPLTLAPKVKGVAVWTSAYQLEFRPAERLPAGQDYVVTVRLDKIAQVTGEDSEFVFELSTIEQSFEIEIDGLRAADADTPRLQQLTGTLTTADATADANIEKILSASFQGTDLEIAWTHDQDRRRHRFLVTGISRADEEESYVTLDWIGAPIGVDKSSSSRLPVPPMSSFKVSQLRAIQGQEQCIEIRFTDPLAPDQSLQGLIRVEGKSDLRFTIEGSVVRVYASEAWAGTEKVTVDTGVRNSVGYRLRESRQANVEFETLKPQVRFAGAGVIVPGTQGLTIPIEVANLGEVVVEALQVHDDNIPQFLQVNDLDGSEELKRVGRVVWRKTVSLDMTPDRQNRWVRYGLDMAPLVQRNPAGLYRLQLSFRRNQIIYQCPELTPDQAGMMAKSEQLNLDDEQEESYWDSWESGLGYTWWELYQNRHDPCKPGYYREYHDHDIRASRNILVSDIGIVAKAGTDGSILVVATNLQTAEPLRGARVEILDYQQQLLTSGKTDGGGVVSLKVVRKPYLAVVRHGDEVGFLKLDDGSALSLSHFDVAGAKVEKGLKGYLYGERGVWRPGDTLHLTFILLDSDKRLPDNHPVRFELKNSRGQLVTSIIRTRSVNGFYPFEVATDADAPTGTYTATITVGGASFEKSLRVETVMPNRLKIGLELDSEIIQAPRAELRGTLSAAWLHGATAKNLDADVEVTLQSQRTRFNRYADFSFDDPTRVFSPSSQTIFEGRLDDRGAAQLAQQIEVSGVAPGMLRANLRTRVFEPGGAFSVDRFNVTVSPFERYVGILTPKGDKARGMLLTDTKHNVDIVAVDAHGNLAGDGQVELKLYQIRWRWWWEKGDENLADYAGSNSYTARQSGKVALVNGKATWSFEIKYPEWGRYLLVAEDMQSGHRAGKIIYIDWPGWAGRAQKDSPGGASVLTFTADKTEYAVGDRVAVTIPTAKQGRGLVTIESGTRVLDAEWIEGGAEEASIYTFKTTPEMTPNVYIHVTYIQPHLQTGNDLPIRMYGVIPIKVVDPETRLSPTLECADVFKPEEIARLTVREQSGRAMTYTVAIVDEGLLGLTRFATPDPWDHFFRREALGVKTWDLYDQVAGAYGATLDRILSIGGDEEGGESGQKRANRFPPMVRFLGPFELKKGKKAVHEVDIPQYLGAVRVMVVGGQDGAFGSTDKSVFVRKPLMALGTLPRVLGPDEQVKLPVSVFVMEDKVKNVTVEVRSRGPIEVAGAAQKKLTFSEPGDELVGFDLVTQSVIGVATVEIEAWGGGERIVQTIEIDIRMPSLQVVDVIGAAVAAGKSWSTTATAPGIAGTNQAQLEVSQVPPIDLGRRLEFLIRYPHGCVEQTTSSVFPQLYLKQLIKLSPDTEAKIEENVRAGIERLKTFQTSDGGFAYWPLATGGIWVDNNRADEWGSSYAGHFLLEAKRAGYLVPAGILDQWQSYQRGRASSWVVGGNRSELNQAYRLYTLALAGAADLGAMNRLRESHEVSVPARWRLAASYQLAGQPETAETLTRNLPMAIKPYRELSGTYGSDVRDKAMVLETLLLMDRPDQAKPLADDISAALSDKRWMSTQTTAYALIAMARLAGLGSDDDQMSFSYSWAGSDTERVTGDLPLLTITLPIGDETQVPIKLDNTGRGMIFPRLVLSGVPPVGFEQPAANDMTIDVQYQTLDGGQLDPSIIEQGTDFKVLVSVQNTGKRGAYEEIALSHLFASGWEIHNQRLDPSGHLSAADVDFQDIRDDRIYTYFDLQPGETKQIEVSLNASYVGRFYQPLIEVEAMYDATINAREVGRWVRVVKPGS